MENKIAALLHVQELNRELLFAYDNLMAECYRAGDDEEGDEWLRKSLDVIRHNDRISDEIDRLRMEYR